MTLKIKDKTDGDIYYAADTDGRSDIFLSNTLRLQANAIKAGDTNVTLQQLKYDNTGKADASSTDTSTSSIYSWGTSAATGIVYCRTFDDFEDASIDGAKWSTSVGTGASSVTETSGYLRVSSAVDVGAFAEAQGLTNYKGSDYTLVVDVENLTSAAGTPTTQIRISDGSTKVVVYTIPKNTRKYIRLVFDSAGNAVDVYDDTSSLDVTATNISLAGISAGPWYIDFYTNADSHSSGSEIRPYFVGDDFTTATPTYESSTALTGGTWKAGFGYTFNVLNSPSTIQFSGNNGSAYTSGAVEDLITIGTSGTQGKIKVTKSISAAGGVYINKGIYAQFFEDQTY